MCSRVARGSDGVKELLLGDHAGGMVIDHVVMVVPDGDRAARELREHHGLGSEVGMYYERAGTRHYNVPLLPPQLLEVVVVENRDVAASTETGRRVLQAEADGRRVFAWSVLVDDLEAVAERLGIEIFDYTVPHGDGTLRGWRAVSGPAHLPFFIDYPQNGDRAARLQAMYDRVGHTSAPSAFASLTVGGSRHELDEWLGPHDLPLEHAGGAAGIHAAAIATTAGVVTIR
jgi:hypothetical protein